MRLLRVCRLTVTKFDEGQPARSGEPPSKRGSEMPTLFFLPWVPCDTEIALGPVKLLPFERTKRPGPMAGISQADFDAILGAYAEPAYIGKSMGKRVDRATIVWWDGDSSTSELTDDDIAKRLAFGQMIVFAALAERRFGTHSYWNADCLAMVAQRFAVGNASHLAIRTRRRDGYGMNMVSASDAPIFLRPHHANCKRVEFDERLVVAINDLPAGALRDRILDSITVFNRANTDSQDVSLATELVLLRVAFETLFQATHAAPDLRKKIADHFDRYRPKVAWVSGPIPEATWRARWPADVSRPLDAWVQDFCAARNNSAHGTTSAGKYALPVWSSPNHALFASFFFPMCVKSILADAGAYTLSERDKDYLCNCEAFMAYDILAMTPKEKLQWDEVDERIRWIELGRSIAALAKAPK